MNAGADNHAVRLAAKIPVYIVYFTRTGATAALLRRRPVRA
jgi:hypothetical protein